LESKYIVDGFLIVEGKSDIAFLSSFLNVEIVAVLGNVIPKDELEYIRKLSEKYKPIILTDNDEAGKRIRERLNKEILNAININVEVPLGKKGKHGVAESNKDDVISLLNPYFMKEEFKKGNITLNDLYELRLTGEASNRNLNVIKEKYKVGLATGSKLVKRLNMLNISKEELEETLYGDK